MIRLPRTLHIEGSRLPQGKADPTSVQFAKLAEQFLVMEEKVDGSGVSIFFDDHLAYQIWHRGGHALGKEFAPLFRWVDLHQDELFDLLSDRYILFGEWMLHKHTVFYDCLPNYFLESDIYDRQEGIWLSTMARNNLMGPHSFIRQVPVIGALKPTRLSQLTNLIGKPLYQSDKWRNNLWTACDRMNQPLDVVLAQTEQSDLMEGLYIKHENDNQVLNRYKYVRYEFVDFIVNSGSHLIDREPIHNISVGGYSF